MADIGTQLRDALVKANKNGRTGYAIAKAAGLKPEIIYRFERGDDLRLSSAAKVAAVLGLELVPVSYEAEEKKPARRKTKK